MEETKLTCRRDVNELDRIVDETSMLFEDNNTPRSIRHVVEFAIEEMFVNMVKYNTETDSDIEIVVSAIKDGIKVSLTDHNVDRFDPSERAPLDVDAPLEDRTPGGLGVFLTLKLVDSFTYDYHDRTSKITFIKRQEAADV